MKILLAVSERDLLLGLKKILELDGGEVTAAFDGVQAMDAIGEGRYDIAVIYEKLPRVSLAKLIDALYASGIPSVVLTSGALSERTLCGEGVPSAFLAFPFAPEELRGIINAVYKKSACGASYAVSGVRVNEKRFALGSSRLTLGELDILSAVACGERTEDANADLYIAALNAKLAKERAGKAIKYLKNQGYRLVNENE